MYGNDNQNQQKPRLVYSGSITLTGKKDKSGNLAGLKGGCIMNIPGKDGAPHQCVVIPIDLNPGLFVNDSDKSVSLDLNIYENASVKFGQTHHIRPSVGQRGKTMSEQARREATPIIGNLKPFTPKPQNQQGDLGGGYSPYPQGPQGSPQQGFQAPAAPAAPTAPVAAGGYNGPDMPDF